MKKIFQIVCILICFFARPANAQRPASEQRLAKVFVDCRECSADNLREELKFVDIVRDRLRADVVIMITNLPTASGGRAFSIELIPSTGSLPRGDTIVVNVRPDATELEQRTMLARSLKIALLPFIQESSAIKYLDVVYNPPLQSANEKRGASDRWNKWVYRLSGSGSFASDEEFSAAGGDGGVSASHITDDIKIELSAKGSYNREKYRLSSDETVISERKSWTTKSLVVRSLTDHLSLGLNGSAGSSAFQNTKLQIRAMPAIEYDLYPYRDATQRQLIVRYGVGIRAAQYNDTTIYGEIAETRPIHELSAVADVRRPWGNVWGSALWSQYLHDASKRRLTTEAGVDWRIIAGLSLNVSARYVFIRDQLNIQGTNLTDQERLLRLREVQSGYSLSGGIGLSYTFGSVFSNIVNPRFRL